MGELLARLRAALRRTAKAPGDPVFISGSLKVDLSKRLVTVAGQEVSLTPNEYGLLRVMVTQAGKVLTHRHMIATSLQHPRAWTVEKAAVPRSEHRVLPER